MDPYQRFRNYMQEKQPGVVEFFRPTRRKVSTAVGVVALAAILSTSLVATHHGHAPQPVVTDPQAQAVQLDALLSPDNWQYMAGVSAEADGIHVTGLDREIVNQDGTGGQPNPPVNLTGPHLEVSGDFEIDATMKGISDKPVSIDLYGEVPVVYDEWRHEGARVRMSLTKDNLAVSVWDGTKETPASTQTVAAKLGDKAELRIKQAGHTITIADGPVALGVFEDGKAFGGGKVWFGLDGTLGAPAWTLSSLKASALPGGKVQAQKVDFKKPVAQDAGALRSLAAARTAHPIQIGAAVSLDSLATNGTLRGIVGREISQITTENALKLQFVHPQPDVYTFAEADALVDFAKANNITVHGHALLFGEANPAYLQKLPATERQKAAQDLIAKIVGHYKGRVAEWDVVNEPLADDDTSLRTTIWQKAMGESLFDVGFQAARQADPQAKLFINEYGLEADGERWDNFLALVDRLLARHVPVDGVGFQAHVYEAGDEIDQTVLRKHFKQLASRGLVARISEMDVHGEDPAFQAGQYAGVLKACLAESNCLTFGTWGVSDAFGSTTEARTYPPSYGDDLLWNDQLQPKAAYSALNRSLR